jgi:L-iditol 2-dehydrogenase
MIAAKFTQGGGMEIGEAPEPTIGPEEILVRIDATSICGTDIKIIHRGHRKLAEGRTIILGHEFAGTIAKAGLQVKDYVEGQRVGVAPNIGCGCCEPCGAGQTNVCPDYSAFGIDRDGSHTEFIRIPGAAIAQGNVIPLSNGVSPAEAALAEPLSCAVNGGRVSRIGPGDTVLIYGAGPMGLLNLMVALISGAARVFVVDPNVSRLQRAKALGASQTFDCSDGEVRAWITEQTGGRGVDVVIAAAPVSQIQSEGVQVLAPFGRLCLFAGLPPGESTVRLDTNAIHYKNLIVTGMTGGSPQDYRIALKLIEARRVDVRQVISHVFALSELGRAYEVALAGKGMKVLIAAQQSLSAAQLAQAALGNGNASANVPADH